MAEAFKNLATKKKVDNALEIGDQTSEKKIKRLILSYFFVNFTLMMMGLKTI